MTKKILVGFLLIGLALTASAGISFAADKSGANGATSGFIAGCRGFLGGATTELSKLLGLNPDQIAEKRKAGESLADIAKDQGISQSKVVDTIIESRKKILDERVQQGNITQDQENTILDRMRQNITTRIQNPTVGPGSRPGGCGCGGGPGAGGCGCGGPGACLSNPPVTPNTPTSNTTGSTTTNI